MYVSPNLSVCFGGVGVTVEEGAITLEPKGYLFSSDYMGRMISLDIAGLVSDCWFNFSMLYVNSSSVAALYQLYAAFMASISLEDSYVDMSGSTSGFFGLSLNPADNQPARIQHLELPYNSSAPQTLYSQMTSEKILEALAGYEIGWQSILGGIYTSSQDFYTMVAEKWQKPVPLKATLLLGSITRIMAD